MATPINDKQLIAQLKKWKVPYREIDGWRTRGRDAHTGLAFGPVYGAVQHHTGDDAPDVNDRNVIINGRAGLPGPLAQFGANDDGVIDIISIHRCNHAGGGDAAVKQAVINESYGKYPPATHKHEGSKGAVDGNDCFYGCEAYYSGGHRPTAKQYDSMCRLWAAIFDFHGWSAKSLIAHKEWSDYKVDPGYIDMAVMRNDVALLLKNGPDGHTPSKEKAVTKTPNITKAIAANVEYAKALNKINNSSAKKDIDDIKADVMKQRRTLQRHEKK